MCYTISIILIQAHSKCTLKFFVTLAVTIFIKYNLFCRHTYKFQKNLHRCIGLICWLNLNGIIHNFMHIQKLVDFFRYSTKFHQNFQRTNNRQHCRKQLTQCGYYEFSQNFPDIFLLCKSFFSLLLTINLGSQKYRYVSIKSIRDNTHFHLVK